MTYNNNNSDNNMMATEKCSLCGRWVIEHESWFHMLDYHNSKERKVWMRNYLDKVKIIG